MPCSGCWVIVIVKASLSSSLPRVANGIMTLPSSSKVRRLSVAIGALLIAEGIDANTLNDAVTGTDESTPSVMA